MTINEYIRRIVKMRWVDMGRYMMGGASPSPGEMQTLLRHHVSQNIPRKATPLFS